MLGWVFVFVEWVSLAITCPYSFKSYFSTPFSILPLTSWRLQTQIFAGTLFQSTYSSSYAEYDKKSFPSFIAPLYSHTYYHPPPALMHTWSTTYNLESYSSWSSTPPLGTPQSSAHASIFHYPEVCKWSCKSLQAPKSLLILWLAVKLRWPFTFSCRWCISGCIWGRRLGYWLCRRIMGSRKVIWWIGLGGRAREGGWLIGGSSCWYWWYLYFRFCYHFLGVDTKWYVWAWSK